MKRVRYRLVSVESMRSEDILREKRDALLANYAKPSVLPKLSLLKRKNEKMVVVELQDTILI